MTGSRYTDHPDLYDAVQSEWDYDRDVAFVESVLADHDVDGRHILEVGCGTGEHTRRFVAAGSDVTAVDPAEGMLAAAREKCDAHFHATGLPDLAVEGEFDAAVALRGVVNHLSPADLEPALAAVAARLRHGGVIVFDNSPLPTDGNEPGLDVGTTERGRYVRVAQMQARTDGRLDWVSVVFGPDCEVITTRRPMTPFSDETLADALTDLGFDIETHDGFGPSDDRTVFFGVR